VKLRLCGICHQRGHFSTKCPLRFLPLVFSLISCSDAIASQPEPLPNPCHQDYIDEVNLVSCYSLVHFYCTNGLDQWIYVPAEGANFMGTVCYQDENTTHVYACVDDHSTFRAAVRCR
jgi:hypothetical protein